MGDIVQVGKVGDTGWVGKLWISGRGGDRPGELVTGWVRNGIGEKRVKLKEIRNEKNWRQVGRVEDKWGKLERGGKSWGTGGECLSQVRRKIGTNGGVEDRWYELGLGGKIVGLVWEMDC